MRIVVGCRLSLFLFLVGVLFVLFVFCSLFLFLVRLLLVKKEPRRICKYSLDAWARLRGRETPISCENEDVGLFWGLVIER